MKKRLRKDLEWIKGKWKRFFLTIGIWIGLWIFYIAVIESSLSGEARNIISPLFVFAPIPLYISLYLFEVWLYGDEKEEVDHA